MAFSTFSNHTPDRVAQDESHRTFDRAPRADWRNHFKVETRCYLSSTTYGISSFHADQTLWFLLQYAPHRSMRGHGTFRPWPYKTSDGWRVRKIAHIHCGSPAPFAPGWAAAATCGGLVADGRRDPGDPGSDQRKELKPNGFGPIEPWLSRSGGPFRPRNGAVLVGTVAQH